MLRNNAGHTSAIARTEPLLCETTLRIHCTCLGLSLLNSYLMAHNPHQQVPPVHLLVHPLARPLGVLELTELVQMVPEIVLLLGWGRWVGLYLGSIVPLHPAESAEEHRRQMHHLFVCLINMKHKWVTCKQNQNLCST